MLVHFGSSQAFPKPGKLDIKAEYHGLLMDTATGKTLPLLKVALFAFNAVIEPSVLIAIIAPGD